MSLKTPSRKDRYQEPCTPEACRALNRKCSFSKRHHQRDYGVCGDPDQWDPGRLLRHTRRGGYRCDAHEGPHHDRTGARALGVVGTGAP